ISWINSSTLYVISADTPSGTNCNTGETPGETVYADLTVTFGLPKIGQFFLPAKQHVGSLKIHEIGLPKKEIAALCSKTLLIDRETAFRGIKKRLGNEDKNRVGRVLVIAGSTGMTGAAVLTAMAALRSGAGIVTLLVPESLNTIFEIKLTEEMTIPLADNSKGFFCINNVETAKVIASNYDVVAIGPGLGRSEETIGFVKGLLLSPEIKAAVIDADALFALSNDTEIISNLKYPVVITPHEREFRRLISPAIIPVKGDERVTFLRKTAKKFKKTVIVLKGSPSLVCCDAEEVYINTTGNAGMATAGSGDVLTGITAALLAQNKDASSAAVSAVYLHGLSGDMAKEKLTEYAMTSGDIITFLPEAFKECIKENDE
ncbi:MAG: NAD(P)H-hydrate dehydratase, partial [Fibrobacteres bacterium]|nr:NAD(P)H-hydrate dehydratase [Fibrobacterota bacterium]